MKSVVFNKDGYEPLIDYLKGVCILFVVIQHSISNLLHSATGFAFWGRFAVPLFLLIQVFHAYKHLFGNEICDTTSRKVEGGVKITKIWKRIILPFLYVQIFLVLKKLIFEDVSFMHVVDRFIHAGGFGSGGYYPWIYVQFAIVLPVVVHLFKKHGRKTSFLICILIAQLLEFICCISNIPDWLYRLCFFRYFFIIYLGYILVTEGLVINIRSILLSIASMLTVAFFTLNLLDLTPVFYSGSPAWRQCHWPCYFYMCFGLLPILCLIWRKTENIKPLADYLLLVGRYSYEIFLFQMIWFSIIGRQNVGGGLLLQTLFMVVSVIVCIVPVVYVKKKMSLNRNN